MILTNVSISCGVDIDCNKELVAEMVVCCYFRMRMIVRMSRCVGITGTEVMGAAVHVTGQFFLMLREGNLASGGWLALCSSWLYNGG